MKRIFTVIYLSVLLLSASALKARQKIDTNQLSKKLDEYLASAAKFNKFNGSVLIVQRGKIMLDKGYGWKDFANHTANDHNSIYQIGSLTKPFTAMVILKLQEEGKLSVNDKLSKYYPEQKGADKITIQNLLDHTSGINNYTDVIGPEDSATVSRPVPRQKILEIFNQKPLAFKPGSKYDYCNSGYFLLGIIIEKLTGMTYEQAVRKLILEPLDMGHSGFDFIHLNDTSKTTGYVNADKHLPAIKWDSTVTYSAGALYSTTGDLYKWGTAVAKGLILNKDSWKQAFTPRLEHYGDGWFIDTLYGNRYVYHSGGMPGFMSNFIYYPDQDITIILLNNFGDYEQSLWPINIALSAILFDKPYTLWQTNTAVKVDNGILQQYTGTYTVDGKIKILVTLEDGQLYAQGNSSQSIPKVPIFPKTENTFFLKDFNATFTFLKDAGGRVSKFISHENGKEIELRKIK
jgi:CubicO group peptidase (beta-lactamase class C family)